MQPRYLGKTGVSVSSLCLGAMMFGQWGTRDHDESIRIHHAPDAGINFIDTADVYSAGESEEIVGKALAGGRREHVVLATKAHMPMGDDVNQRGNSRRPERSCPPGQDPLDRPFQLPGVRDRRGAVDRRAARP